MSIQGFRGWLSLKLKDHNLPQRQLAERAGYSEAFVSLVLSNNREPDADFCIQAAKALGESPIEALEIAGFVPPTSDNPFVAEATRILSDLPPDRLACALAMLRGLREG